MEDLEQIIKKIKKKRKPRRSKTVFFLIFIINFAIGCYIGYSVRQEQLSPFVTLTMVYSSEKQSWINSIVNEFFAWVFINTGLIVNINFEAMGSRAMVVSTMTGEIKPTILSPASSIWLNYTNMKLATIGRPPLIFENLTERVIYSPIVIGTWRLFNKTWNIEGFNSLLTIPFLRWSHTDPQLSNSGTMSVIMEVAEFLDLNTSEIQLPHLYNLSMITKMAILESQIPFYGGSTGFLAKKALDGSLDVFMVYENLIIDMNKKELALARGGAKAVYPENGTLLADHPFCILAGDWVDPLELLVAKMFLNFIKLPQIVERAIEKGFRPINESILEEYPKINDTFNQVFTDFPGGVQREIPCPIYNPNINYFVLDSIPELWIRVRSLV